MLATTTLRMLGWKLVQVAPPGPKGVIMVYPHTSNWDFPLGVLARAALRLDIAYVAKDSLFRPPLGAIFRALGGIPVNRRISTGFVGQLVERFQRADSLYVAIAPEGTRSHVDHLKSGFYHLALQAKVPLGLAFIDYRRKEVGIGTWLELTGDVARDLNALRTFYADKHGKRPANAGRLALRNSDPS